MQLRLDRISRLEKPHGWLVLMIGLWASIVTALHLLGRFTGQDILICILRRTTGIPCPTCGSTRAVFGILSGDVIGGFLHNPFVVIGLLVLGVIAALRIVWARRLSLGLSSRGKALAWAAVAVLFLLNWWHVIVYHQRESQPAHISAPVSSPDPL